MKYNQPYDQTNPAAGYVNGDPSTNTAGSIPCAEGLEYPQREIVNAIVAAGLTPTNGDLTQLAQAINALVGRQTVTGVPVTYYVNAAIGSDLNTGLSSGTALATIQRAIDLGSRMRTLGGVAIGVNVADGTYAPFTVAVRDTQFSVVGNVATPGNCIIANPVSGNACALIDGARATIQGFRFTGQGTGLRAINAGIVKIGALEFGITGSQATGGYSVYALDSSTIRAIGPLRQLAAAIGSVFVSGPSSTIDLNAQTITLDAFTALVASGVPGMTVWANLGFAKADGVIWAGAGPASAKRYQADASGSIYTNGAGPAFIPGTIAGSGTYS